MSRAARVAIATVALGGDFPLKAARMIQEFHKHSPGFEIQAWVNTLPPGAEKEFVNGYDYTPYIAKPFALKALMDSGADIGILLDASIYPIRHIAPLIAHIGKVGYYMAPAGFTIGEWTSDSMLNHFGMGRDDAMAFPDCASGCVGLEFNRQGRCLVDAWCSSWEYFEGPHSNINAADKSCSYRNEGFVSNDPRCRGHRHDQAALSIIAHQLGMTKWVPWPKFVAYKAGFGGAPDESTCLVIDGGI